MNLLPYDCCFEIFSYCNHDDIYHVYCSSKLIQHIISHLCQKTSFIVHCDFIISDFKMYWFSIHDIPFQLLIHCIKNDEMEQWYRNGKRHRDNDLPAIWTKSGLKMWYRDGILCRDDNKLTIQIDNFPKDYALFQQILYSK
jgi:hypothetical protein